MTKKQVIIIGGGASGLFTAIELAKFGVEVLILERLDRVGKKILSTGNGMANITNLDMKKERYHSSDESFFVPALEEFNERDTIKFFNELGILTKADSNGKVYPRSMQSQAILDSLRFKLEELKVEILVQKRVVKINKRGDIFEIICEDKEIFYCDICVTAFGGSAGRQFGTDGTSYQLLENLQHKLTKTYPSLVQLKTNTENIRGLKGLKLEARLRLFSAGKFVAETFGDLLFTDYGISGNAVFYLSGKCLKAVEPTLKIDFISEIDEDEIFKILSGKIERNPFLKARELFTGIILRQVGENILKMNGVKLDGEIASTKLKLPALCKTVKNFPLQVLGSSGFDYAQVTIGGIDVSDFDKFTLESKVVKNLYSAGELLDVDGDCGGYNLQWAWSSGKLVAKSIIHHINKDI